MKLKSYLRGLGLGMIITTVILVVAFIGRNVKYTDEDIISRAYELGMVETSLYSSKGDDSSVQQPESSSINQTDPTETQSLDVIEESSTDLEVESSEVPTTTETEIITQAETETEPLKPLEPPTANASIIAASVVKPVIQPVSEPTTEETTSVTSTTAAVEEITLLFEDISTATKASEILYNAGLIDSVEGFNEYLSVNGIATKVGEGEFTFTTGMSYEEISKIITRTR